MVALVLVAVFAPLSLTSAQITYTSTTTQTTDIYSTGTVISTITNTAVVYTTTTLTTNSTIQGTQTRFEPSLTTVSSTYVSTVSGAITVTTTVVVTQISTQTEQILGNVWGESLALVALVGAVASYLIPKAGASRPKGLVCGKCGNRNPPFATAYCVKCGHSLKGES